MNMDEYNPWNNQNNPWEVENLEDFLYFCCPECNLSRDSIYQNKKLFLQHALEKHPNAKEYLLRLEIKKEPIEEVEQVQIEYDTLPIKSEYKEPEVEIYEQEIVDENEINDQKETNPSEIEWHDGDTIKEYNFVEEKCKKCDFVGKSKYALLRHSEKHRECKKCGKDFMNVNSKKRDYERHIKKCSVIHQCPKCSKIFPHKSSLLKHLTFKTCRILVEKQRTCNNCGKEFISAKNSHAKRDYENHIKKCIGLDENTEMLEPEILVNDVPTVKSELQDYYDVDNANESVENTDVSNTTDYIMQDQNDTEEPVNMVKNENLENKDGEEKPNENTNLVKTESIETDINKESGDPMKVKEEMQKSINKDKNIKYGCKLCGKSFKDFLYLKDHIHFIHEGKKNHKCGTCGETFGYKAKLHLHMSIHSNDKFACGQCNRVFGKESTLQKHVSIVHEGVKMYKCEFCSKDFTTKAMLKLHIETQHEIETVACHLCGKTFNHAKYLKSHIETVHEEKKPYKCDKCGKSFVW